MAVRDDIRVDMSFDPRIAMVDSPSVSVSISDLHDTLKVIGARPQNMNDPKLLTTTGGDDLPGGAKTALTSNLNNTVVGFEARTTPASTGTATSDDSTGRLLTDSTATFQTDGVIPGASVINWVDRSTATVLKVISQTELLTEKLAAGANNDWEIGDDYSIFNVVQCTISEGNLGAKDEYGVDINPIFPTAWTQVSLIASSAATIINDTQLESMMTRLLGLSHENSFMDNIVHDENDPPQLKSARLRCFDSKANADAAIYGGNETTGLIATYSITADYKSPGKLKDYRMTLE